MALLISKSGYRLVLKRGDGRRNKAVEELILSI